jgi:class 3 adenylate cyclase
LFPDRLLVQVIDWLQQDQRISYRALKRHFALDDDYLEDLKVELIEVRQVAVGQDGKVLVWRGAAAAEAPTAPPSPVPLTYTPPHLVEQILTSRSALAGERKQVTVLFAGLKGSMELLADRDREEARQLPDPVLERMMAAVHRYEGTVNQGMGDGIMALFGAPLAHEDHAVRACYAALAMQTAVKQYAAEVQRRHGVPVQMRVGLNTGEVVGRAIGSDLHMDYTAVGQTTHLAARNLLLVNYRPEYQYRWGSKTYYTQLRLDPLPPVSVAAILHALLGDDTSLAPLTPLLIARTLTETGVLVGETGAYRLAQPLPSIQAPATVQAVLAARIDRLPSEAKRLLQTAAVIGTEVSYPLLTAIADLPDADLRRHLAHLQAAEFLYETRLFPELEHTFMHARMRWPMVVSSRSGVERSRPASSRS